MPEVTLGTVETYSRGRVDVVLDDDGYVTLRRRDVSSREWIFAPAERDRLRELLDRSAMPGQPVPCAYCEDDPGHPDPDDAGTCACRAPGCGRGWCPRRDDEAAAGA